MTTRDILQKEAIQAVLDDRYVIVNWGTGVGKSRVAVLSADALHSQGCRRMLLLVAETSHKENWRREFVDVLGEERTAQIWSSLVVECYASLPKYEWTRWNFIIADEAHHLRSENRTDIISTMAADRFLCLTATMSCKGDADELLKTLEMTNGVFRNFDFSVQDAIDNGILKKPRIFVHYLCLDDFKCRQDIIEQWGPKEKRVELTCDYEQRDAFADRSSCPAAVLTIRATPRQAYDYFTEKIDAARQTYVKARSNYGLRDDEENPLTERLKTQIKLFGNYRKMVLGRSKTVFARWLLEKKVSGRKFVCFCSNVEQAKELGGGAAICAERSDENAAVIGAFNSGASERLFAVGMAKEGLNLRGIQTGVIIQLGGKERDFIQEIGRAFRSDDPEQHIIVIAGTRDEDYYDNISGIFDSRYIIKKYYGKASQYEGKSRAEQLRPVEDPALPGLARVQRNSRREESPCGGNLTVTAHTSLRTVTV